MNLLLSEYMYTGSRIPGTIVDRILKLDYSPVDVLLNNVCDRHVSVIYNIMVLWTLYGRCYLMKTLSNPGVMSIC